MHSTTISGSPRPTEAAPSFIPLGQVAGWLRVHGLTTKIHANVPYRWFSRGILLPNGQRVRLSCLKFGKLLCTTPTALIEFASQLGQGGSFRRKPRAPRSRSRPPEKIARAIRAAGARLADDGI